MVMWAQDEWTGEQKLQYTDVADDIEPTEIRPMGNYAVSITWPDGFGQIAPYDQLQQMERLVDVPQPSLTQLIHKFDDVLGSAWHHSKIWIKITGWAVAQ
ncbi:hypothetical protein RJ640_024307 [Escallonia rubra]|uniref:Gamma-butyrobetaine hydroxylase-like N-terminal domain-containing protein n=1 Tax=Escallonia rubra TaxID=112253 RepID=A0AA88RLT0_9ASTE|nr:hypothetical protein RJ640_024307 [Escallonia rubra]